MNGHLPSGKLENGEVVCPVHRERYDVKTGKLVKMTTGHSARDLKAYVVKIGGEDILIDI
jgi:nitrite reductase/ring-hydroxylating ferredoxin subunit